jgi:hypothetical protein
MIGKVDLLVNTNLVRHINNKLSKLDEILKIGSEVTDSLLLDSLLSVVISCFDAAIIDTVKEYVYARPYEIFESMLNDLDKNKFRNKEEIIEMGFEEHLLEQNIKNVKNEDLKGKILRLKEICKIDIELGNERWELIRETIARRNCLIHNDLIANRAYFNQAGGKRENVTQGERLEISYLYLSERINYIKDFLEEIKGRLEAVYTQNTNVSAVKRLWDYLFDNHYPLNFNNCWDTKGNSIIYKGPKLKKLQDSISPRTICLFTAWMSFFNSYGYPDLKYFPEIFYNSDEGRDVYSRKLKYLMDCFEKIDFQGFNVKVYDKE